MSLFISIHRANAWNIQPKIDIVGRPTIEMDTVKTAQGDTTHLLTQDTMQRDAERRTVLCRRVTQVWTHTTQRVTHATWGCREQYAQGNANAYQTGF